MPEPAAAHNPFFIHTFIFGNTFEYVGDEAHRPPAVVTWGTLPETTLISFGPKLPLRRPEGWIERSRLWLANNRYRGVQERHRDLAASAANFATKDQYEKSRERLPSHKKADAIEPYLDWSRPAPPETDTVIPVGGANAEPIALPCWFPQLKLEELPESVKVAWPYRPMPAWLKSREIGSRGRGDSD
ncbi:MAG: hypothetical protein ACQESR_22770 [Planctomycetota bacterium]